jgi:hypothetical protein
MKFNSSAAGTAIHINYTSKTPLLESSTYPTSFIWLILTPFLLSLCLFGTTSLWLESDTSLGQLESFRIPIYVGSQTPILDLLRRRDMQKVNGLGKWVCVWLAQG